MSYCSTNELGKNAKMQDVIEFVNMLDYQYLGVLRYQTHKSKEFEWFEENDYKSWSRIELSIHEKNQTISVSTRTTIGRSYYDLEHQNKTIKLLKKYFGGGYTTDEGKGRLMQAHSEPAAPDESGCHLAFDRFGSNLISGRVYMMNREFKGGKPDPKLPFFALEKNAWIISNNLLLPFLVAIMEDYWKSSYVALLKYSPHKGSILKTKPILNDKLKLVSEGSLSIEQAFAEGLSFQTIATVCKNFNALDPKIDFASLLKKPYHRRKKSLFNSIEEVVNLRHNLIHRGYIDIGLSNQAVDVIFHDVEVSIVKCYKYLTKLYNWDYFPGWGASDK